MTIIPYLLLLGIILSFTDCKKSAKSVGTAPLPRSKGKKGVGRGFSQGFFSKVMREIKSNFCSEMEAATLQLTRPTDTSLPSAPLDDLINCFNAEYENPVFVVTLLSKLSRKLCEPNIYTKLKCLIVLHKITELADPPARQAVRECVDSLQKEKDTKTNQPFFSVESVNDMERVANTVAELETVELTKDYADYVFDFIRFRGDRTNLSQKSLEKADLCLKLLEYGQAIEEKCKSEALSTSQLNQECLQRIKDDREWLVKQLTKISEVQLEDEQIEADVQKALLQYSTSTSTKLKGITAAATGLKLSKSKSKKVTQRDDDDDDEEEDSEGNLRDESVDEDEDESVDEDEVFLKKKKGKTSKKALDVDDEDDSDGVDDSDGEEEIPAVQQQNARDKANIDRQPAHDSSSASIISKEKESKSESQSAEPTSSVSGSPETVEEKVVSAPVVKPAEKKIVPAAEPAAEIKKAKSSLATATKKSSTTKTTSKSKSKSKKQ